MLKKSLIVVSAIALILAAFVAMQSSKFHVQRSIKISASISDIFEQVNDQTKWEAWSPLAKLDAKMTTAYEGPNAGIGSIAKWSGNKEVGKGISVIIESKDNESVKFQLAFEEPMKMIKISEFTFAKEGDDVLVIWKMDGEKNFVGKLMGLVFGCEKMAGKRFEEGLNNLKAVTEKK